MLRERGIRSEVIRIGAYQGDGYCSSRTIMETIIKKRCIEGKPQE